MKRSIWKIKKIYSKKIYKTSFSLLVIGLVFIHFSCMEKEAKNNPSAERPNVLFIMADDMTTQSISAYGDIFAEVAPTPNMDQLASEGMLFDGVMCTNAICGPSRAAILTGNYSHNNGYYKNESGGRFDSTQWTFPQAFQANGYQTSLVGKWHLGTNPLGFDYYKFHANSGQQGVYWDPVYNENGKIVKEAGYATNLTTDFALDWLENQRDQEKPFLMLLQFKAPHRPWDPDQKYEALWDSIEMPYPVTFDDDYSGREQTAGDTEMTMDFLTNRDMKLQVPEGLEGRDRIAWEFFGAKRDEIVQPEGMSYEEAKKWRFQHYIKDYLACVRSVDDNIGRVLDYLKETGLEENTLVVVTSDQGFYLGEHGFFDKRFIYEESLKMPFIVRYPGKVSPASVNKDIISNIDFAPTLLDLAGIETDVPMQGRSFMPILKGETPDDWRQSMYYHYYEFPYWHHVQPHYGLRTSRFTLAHFYYNIDVWELYDLEKDPMQINNLIDDPDYSGMVKELKAELKQLQQYYENDLSLDEFRAITDKDFGWIQKNGEGDSVRNVLTGKKS
jgi:arylsulfatase A-like enzyme